MKTFIIHPDNSQQPVAATLAKEIRRALPADDVVLTSTDAASPEEADLVLAVFSLRHGSFAPTVPCYRDLRDKKVAFVAVLAGPVDASRVRKTVWGTKKQFCGNHVVGAYLCPADDEVAWGVPEREVANVVNFALKTYQEHSALSEPEPLAVNF